MTQLRPDGSGDDSRPTGVARNRHSRTVAIIAARGGAADLPSATAQPEGLLTAGLWAPPRTQPPLAAEPSAAPVGSAPSQLELKTPYQTARGFPSRAGMQRAVPSERPFVGRYVRARPCTDPPRDLAWDAMLRRAAGRGARPPGQPLLVEPSHLLCKYRHRRPGRLQLLLVDLSGSMGGRLMALARRLALAALQHAYVHRDRVAMIAFRANKAAVLFEPTDQVERVHQSLRGLPLGGTTPLGAGLLLAHQVVVRAAARDGSERRRLILISDGRANVSARVGHEAMLAEVEAAALALRRVRQLEIVFLDTTEPGKHDIAAERLATQLGAHRLQLHRLAPDVSATALAALAAWT